MRVIIKNQNYEYTSDYNINNPSQSGWQTQNRDAFKTTEIGGNKVFVKRFEYSKENISGYLFLEKIKGTRISNLPIIYDIVEIYEQGVSGKVVYLFQEFIQGKTFEEKLNERDFKLKPHNLASDIHGCLDAIHKKGFWFSDFVEKNIFVRFDGTFCLIDLDSVISIDVLPNSDNPYLTSINKNYKICISTYFYRNSLNYEWEKIKANLKGDSINMLELFALLAVIGLYTRDTKKYLLHEGEIRKDLPTFLFKTLQTGPLVTTLFHYALNPKNYQSKVLPQNSIIGFLSNFNFQETTEVVLNPKVHAKVFPPTPPPPTLPPPPPPPQWLKQLIIAGILIIILSIFFIQKSEQSNTETPATTYIPRTTPPPPPPPNPDPPISVASYNFQEIIENFIAAENNRDIEAIKSYYASFVYRYYNERSVTPNDIEKHYRKAWKITHYSISTIKNIESISQNEYLVYLDFTRHARISENERTTQEKVYFKFENGKIVETYNY